MCVCVLLTQAGAAVGAGVVPQCTHTPVRAVSVHTLPSWKAELSLQTLINVCGNAVLALCVIVSVTNKQINKQTNK